MKIEKITPLIGALVSGADLTTTNDQEYQAIRQALSDHGVIFFTDQPRLSPEQQVAFAKQFGALHQHPAAPTLKAHPEVFVIHAHAQSKVANGNGWHTDVSCDREPPLATMLQLHTLPSTGGDTLFTSTCAAFETLSAPMQQYLLTLSAHHESYHIYKGRYSDRGVSDQDISYPAALHPVVRTHKDSNRLSLYVNPSFTTRIDGLTAAESRALLQLLYEHQQRPEFQVRFRWRENAIALWDNRCTQHFALWDYWPEERKGHRVTIKGEKPYLDPQTPLVTTKMRLSSRL